MAERHTRAGTGSRRRGRSSPLPPLGRCDRRRRRRRRRLHGDVDGLAHQAARAVGAGAADRVGVCGDGPSGRNGGFVNTLWFSLPTLRRRFGDEAAIAVARAAQAAVNGIGAFCAEQEVDAWYRQAGYLQVSTAPAWDGRWAEALAACRELGEPGACARADRRAGAPSAAGHRSFAPAPYYPGAATVQPARLAHGLRERLARGTAFRSASGPRSGAFRASGAGIVVETARWPGPRRRGGAGRGGLARVGPRSALAADRDLIAHGDHRAGCGSARGDRLDRGRVHHRLTGDDPLLPDHARRADRVRLGRRPGGVRRRGPRGEPSSTRGWSTEIERDLVRFFPGLAGRRVKVAWGGPIDVSPESPAGRREPRRAGFITGSATPVTASGLRTWLAARSPRLRSTGATRRAGWRSSNRLPSTSRRSRFGSSAGRSSDARCFAARRRSRPDGRRGC